MREYTVVAITVQNLIQDGWEFIVDEQNDTIIRAENKSEDTKKRFSTEKDFKDWVLLKAEDF